jgi:hypothetical protein
MYTHHVSFSAYSLLGTTDISCFAIVMEDALNIGMKVCLLYIDLHPFGYTTKSGINRLKGRSTFIIKKDPQTNFHSFTTS